MQYMHIIIKKKERKHMVVLSAEGIWFSNTEEKLWYVEFRHINIRHQNQIFNGFEEKK